MTEPAPDETWLHTDDVRAWLRLGAGVDEDILQQCVEQVVPFVERSRPDQWVIVITADLETRTYTPDGEVYGAAVMLAARLYRRRNSPAGVETLATGVAFVARYDPDIERALRIGSWRRAGAR